MAKLPKIFGFLGRKTTGGNYVPTQPRNGWFPSFVREPFAGAWQQNIEWKRETVLAFHAIFACVTLIASDISKMCIKACQKDGDVWVDIPLPANLDVVNYPNSYQNRIQFFEHWLTSKLTRGNAYVYLVRDAKGRVEEMHILNPDCVLPMVSPDGQVFYQIGPDNLAGIQAVALVVPASEIIHDRFNCLYHPLVGLSPIFACGLAAFNGLKMQHNSALFFENMSRPSGILTAPGAISEETAKLLRSSWEDNFKQGNFGRVAVMGDDLKYQPLAATAVDSDLVAQLGLSAEIVCSTFHVPTYKVSGPPPSFNNIEALEQAYYSQCLQSPIESIELLLDVALAVPANTCLEFDLDGLLRMDTKTQVDTLTAAVKGGLDTPNEARKRMNLPALAGGDTIWLQEQQWPIELLAQRRNPPEKSASGAAAPAGTDNNGDNNPDNNPADNEGAAAGDFYSKAMDALRARLELAA